MQFINSFNLLHYVEIKLNSENVYIHIVVEQKLWDHITTKITKKYVSPKLKCIDTYSHANQSDQQYYRSVQFQKIKNRKKQNEFCIKN